MYQWIAKFIYFKILGWKLEGQNIDVDKCVIMVVPHTHWYDFPLGILIRAVLQIEINFVGKKSLFKAPFGWYFRWLGGAPLNRSKNENKVQSIAQIFNERKVFRLALAPEGTRKKVEEWRTGFYYIATEAKVPIISVAFDFGKKTVKIADPFYPTGDLQADFAEMKKFFVGVVGKIPEYT
jgi:1-acyl-sn-glycerol-3-phosphate acyltransferase